MTVYAVTLDRDEGVEVLYAAASRSLAECWLEHNRTRLFFAGEAVVREVEVGAGVERLLADMEERGEA